MPKKADNLKGNAKAVPSDNISSDVSASIRNFIKNNRFNWSSRGRTSAKISTIHDENLTSLKKEIAPDLISPSIFKKPDEPFDSYQAAEEFNPLAIIFSRRGKSVSTQNAVKPNDKDRVESASSCDPPVTLSQTEFSQRQESEEKKPLSPNMESQMTSLDLDDSTNQSNELHNNTYASTDQKAKSGTQSLMSSCEMTSETLDTIVEKYDSVMAEAKDCNVHFLFKTSNNSNKTVSEKVGIKNGAELNLSEKDQSDSTLTSVHAFPMFDSEENRKFYSFSLREYAKETSDLQNLIQQIKKAPQRHEELNSECRLRNSNSQKTEFSTYVAVTLLQLIQEIFPNYSREIQENLEEEVTINPNISAHFRFDLKLAECQITLIDRHGKNCKFIPLTNIWKNLAASRMNLALENLTVSEVPQIGENTALKNRNWTDCFVKNTEFAIEFFRAQQGTDTHQQFLRGTSVLSPSSRGMMPHSEKLTNENLPPRLPRPKLNSGLSFSTSENNSLPANFQTNFISRYGRTSKYFTCIKESTLPSAHKIDLLEEIFKNLALNDYGDKKAYHQPILVADYKYNSSPS